MAHMVQPLLEICMVLSPFYIGNFSILVSYRHAWILNINRFTLSVHLLCKVGHCILPKIPKNLQTRRPRIIWGSIERVSYYGFMKGSCWILPGVWVTRSKPARNGSSNKNRRGNQLLFTFEACPKN